MEGAIWRILWELLRRAPEYMRKLFYTDSLSEALVGAVFLCSVFWVTQFGVGVFGEQFPEYAPLVGEVSKYLAFLPVIVAYRLFIANNITTKRQETGKKKDLSKWVGYWEAVRMHGKTVGVVKTSLGTVVIYKVKGYPENPYDITPIEGEEENIDAESWRKLYWSFRKFGIGKDPKEVLANL